MITFRALELSDVDVLYQIENEESVWQYSNTNAPYSRFALEQFVLSSAHDFYQDGQLRLVAECDGRCAGIVDLFNYDPHHQRAEVGIYIMPEFRGKGFGAEALRQLISYTERHLQLHQLVAFVAVQNNAAIQCFEHAGFVQSGVLKDWIALRPGIFSDVSVFQCVVR